MPKRKKIESPCRGVSVFLSLATLPEEGKPLLTGIPDSGLLQHRLPHPRWRPRASKLVQMFLLRSQGPQRADVAGPLLCPLLPEVHFRPPSVPLLKVWPTGSRPSMEASSAAVNRPGKGMATPELLRQAPVGPSPGDTSLLGGSCYPVGDRLLYD